MADEEVVLNEHGFPEEDMAEERKLARALARGEAPPEEETPAEVVPAKEEKQEPTAQGASQDATDPLADLPEEHREKIAAILKADRERADRLEHQIKSEKGRQSAFQTKYEEARREAADAKAKLAAQSKTPPKSLKEISPRFKEIAEVDESLVDSFDEVRDRIREELLAEVRAEMKAEMAPLYEERQHNAHTTQQRAQEEFSRTLSEKVANWQDIVFAKDESGNLKIGENNIPEFNPGWAEFLNDQPPAIKAAYQNPQTAQDALRAFKDYGEWGTEKGYFKEEETPAKVPNADAIQQKRQNDLKKATPPKSTPVPLSQSRDLEPSSDADVDRIRKLARESIRKGDPSIFNQR